MPASLNPPRIYQTKEEYVYEVLRTAIMRCELRPGEKLVLDHLSEELNVSTIPIRSALQRLQSEGLVEITPHVGAVVSEISPEMINEIFLLLEALENTAFRVAASKANERDIAYLQSIIAEMDKAVNQSDSDRWYELNSEFHRAVCSITEMPMLIEFTSHALDSWDRLRRHYLHGVKSTRMAVAHAEHQRMIELMKAHDLDGLDKLIRQHNAQAREHYYNLTTRQRQERVKQGGV